MCFSANSSFAAAGTLSVIGLLSIKAAGHNKQLLPLAATPLFFALQQVCEGLVWITLGNGNTTSILHVTGMYGFLFFASAWWPLWIPFALYTAEKLPAHKLLMHKILYIGIATSLVLFIAWTLHTTGAQIVNHHINYPVLDYPFGITNNTMQPIVSWIISIMYIVATVVPFFISSVHYIHIAGIIISVGLVIAYIFYLIAFPSVWCFFEAISSIAIYFIIKNNK